MRASYNRYVSRAERTRDAPGSIRSIRGTDIPASLPGGKTACPTDASLPSTPDHTPMPKPAAPLPIEVDCRTVKGLLDVKHDFLLLDCREADEHARVAIAAATLLPMSELTERLAELEPHRRRRVVVHCHHGGRSLRVTHWLRQQGFAQAQNMAGGIDAWAEQIDPSLPKY